MKNVRLLWPIKICIVFCFFLIFSIIQMSMFPKSKI
jgi:hypothetical protein